MPKLPDEDLLTDDYDPEGDELQSILNRTTERGDDEAPTPDLDEMDQEAETDSGDDLEIDDVALPESEDDGAEDEIDSILTDREEG